MPIRWFERNEHRDAVYYEFGTTARSTMVVGKEQRRHVMDRANRILAAHQLRARCGTYVDGVQRMVFYGLDPCPDRRYSWWWRFLSRLTNNQGHVYRFGADAKQYVGTWIRPDRAFCWRRLVAWFTERDKVWVSTKDLTLFIVGRWRPENYQVIHRIFETLVFKDAAYWRMAIPSDPAVRANS